MSRSKPRQKGTSRRRKGENSGHDHGYKLLFSHPRLVEEFIRGFLPSHWAERLDFSTLERVSGSFVSDDFRERHDDVIWKRIEGMQKIVLSMLRQRFGPVPQVVRQRVKEISSTKELDKLTRRILTAGSLQQTGLV